MKLLAYEFDGKSLKYFNKIPDLAGKMKECRIILRIAEPKVFAIVNQGKGELDFSLEDAFQVLVSSGNAWGGPILDGEQQAGDTDALTNTKRFNLLRRFPLLMGIDVFRSLLTMGWARASGGLMSYSNTVSLQTFAAEPQSFVLLTTRKESFTNSKSLLVDSLKNLEHYFVFAFGMIYDRICSEFIDSLQFGAWSDQKWDLGYTRYSIEMVLYVTFNEIRDIPRASYLARGSAQHDISTPRGICDILTHRFRQLQPSIDRVTEFQRIFSDATARVNLFGNSETAPQQHTSYMALTGGQKAPLMTPTHGSNRMTGGTLPIGSQWCVYDVYNQAGLQNPTSGEVFRCVHGSACTFKHGDFVNLPRQEQQQLISMWTTKQNNKGFARTPATLATKLMSSLDKLRKNGPHSKKRTSN